MHWIEKEQDSRHITAADTERSALLDKVKKESLPTVKKEAENGAPQFQPLELQHLRSPGIYEGEFGPKNEDLIFHFFPHGYTQAAHEGKRPPNFKPGFKEKLQVVMGETFGHQRVEIKEDKDVCAFFVKAKNWGQHQFMKELAIKACEALHKAMGGESDS